MCVNYLNIVWRLSVEIVQLQNSAHPHSHRARLETFATSRERQAAKMTHLYRAVMPYNWHFTSQFLSRLDWCGWQIKKIHSFIGSLVRSFPISLVRSFVRPLIGSLIHALICSLIRSFNHPPLPTHPSQHSPAWTWTWHCWRHDSRSIS